MSFSDDLIRASQAFKESMEGFAQTRAVNRAKENIETLKTQEMMSAIEQRQQQRAIQQQLQQDMLALGASPQEAVASGLVFAPPEATSPTADIREGVEFQSPEVLKQGITKQTYENQPKFDLEMMKRKTAQAGKQDDKLDDALKFFQGDDATESLREKNRELRNLEQFLTPINGKVDVAQLNTGIKALAKTVEGGRLTDQDFELARVNQDLFSGIQRSIKKLATGEALPKDADELRQLARVIQAKAVREMKQRVSSFSQSRGRRTGLNPKVIEQTIINELGIGLGVEQDGKLPPLQPINQVQPPAMLDRNQQQGYQPGPTQKEESLIKIKGLSEIPGFK